MVGLQCGSTRKVREKQERVNVCGGNNDASIHGIPARRIRAYFYFDHTYRSAPAYLFYYLRAPRREVRFDAEG
jgi:hypothetical protein